MSFRDYNAAAEVIRSEHQAAVQQVHDLWSSIGTPVRCFTISTSEDDGVDVFSPRVAHLALGSDQYIGEFPRFVDQDGFLKGWFLGILQREQMT